VDLRLVARKMADALTQPRLGTGARVLRIDRDGEGLALATTAAASSRARPSPVPGCRPTGSPLCSRRRRAQPDGGQGAQVMARSRELVDDFLVVEGRRSLHVANARPATTSSFAIGRLVARRAAEALRALTRQGLAWPLAQ